MLTASKIKRDNTKETKRTQKQKGKNKALKKDKKYIEHK